MQLRVSIGSVVLSCLVSSVALAQPGTDDGMGAPPPPPPAGDPTMAPPMPPPPPPQPPAEPPSTTDRGIVEDANAGRSWVAPTALTEPAGTWSFSDYQLFLASLQYSPTDQVSLSATTLLPVFGGMPFWLLLSGKVQVVKSGNVRAVVHGALAFASVKTEVYDSASGTETTERESTVGAVLGGALTYCIDAECRSSVTGYVGAGFAHEDQSAVPLLLAASGAFSVSKHVKILVEADTGYIAGGGIDAAVDGVLAWYGVRFTSKIIGVDLGFAYPICDGCEEITDEIPMGFPFVSFTYRSLK